MDDESAEAQHSGRRPFASYTPADHARVSLAANMMFLAGQCHQAIIPERYAGEDTPSAIAGIRAAASILERARNLLQSAVIAGYESGLTWEQIGQARGITRQSAHAAYAPAVAEFRHQLAAAITRTEHGGDSDPLGSTRICDTAWYAPYLDQVTATVEHPGMLAPPAKPGDFISRLSDPDTAAPVQLAGVRGPDAPAPLCPYTQQLDDPYGDDGIYGWLTCTLPEGHPGRRHQLAVTTEE